MGAALCLLEGGDIALVAPPENIIMAPSSLTTERPLSVVVWLDSLGWRPMGFGFLYFLGLAQALLLLIVGLVVDATDGAREGAIEATSWSSSPLPLILQWLVKSMPQPRNAAIIS